MHVLEVKEEQVDPNAAAAPSPEEKLSTLDDALEVEGITLARFRFLRQALDDQLPPESYTLPEVMAITGHRKTQADEDKRWAKECGLFPSVRKIGVCMGEGSFKEDLGEEEVQNIYDPVERTALDQLRKIGWGRMNGYLVSNWQDNALAFLQRFGDERVLYAIEYAEKRKAKTGTSFGPGYITQCLRNEGFQPPDDWSPTLDIEQETCVDEAYVEQRDELICQEIEVYEGYCCLSVAQQEHFRSEWAGTTRLDEAPLYLLEEYRGYLWKFAVDKIGPSRATLTQPPTSFLPSTEVADAHDNHRQS